MISDYPFFVVRDKTAFSLRPRHDPLNRSLKLLHSNPFLIIAGGKKRGLIGQQALLALPPPDAEGKRRVKSEWGTFGDTTRSLGITEHTQRLEDFLKAKNKPLTDFQVVRQVIERDDAALDAWLREQGASLTDYQEARTSEPSVRLWPNGEAKKVLSSLDLATAAAAALGHP